MQKNKLSKLLLFSFILIGIQYIGLWGITLYQMIFTTTIKSTYTFNFIIYVALGIALFQIWKILIEKRLKPITLEESKNKFIKYKKFS